jgi:hypothetical protein
MPTQILCDLTKCLNLFRASANGEAPSHDHPFSSWADCGLAIIMPGCTYGRNRIETSSRLISDQLLLTPSQAHKDKPPPMITHFLPGLIVGWLLSRFHAQRNRTSEEGSEPASEKGVKRKGGKPVPRRTDLPKGVVQKSGPASAAPQVFANDGQELKMVRGLEMG